MKMILRLQSLLVIVLCALALPLSAQKAQKAAKAPKPTKEAVQANAALQEILKKYEAVGISVAVVKNNEIIYTKAVGKKNIEQNVDLQPDNIFNIASISKSFVATTIFTLIEEGKLSLDDDVSDLLGFKVRNPRFPDTPITLRMFMSHSSSLKGSSVYGKMTDIDTQDEEVYAKSFYDYAPGTKYNYCNFAFNLMGNIIERVSGQRFDVAVRTRVILPLGLQAGYTLDSLDKSKFVTLYLFRQDKNTGEWIKTPRGLYAPKSMANYKLGYSAAGVFSPTGGMNISAPDLAYYMRMHMNYGVDPATGVRIISEANSRLMQSPQIFMGSRGEKGDYCMALRSTASLIDGKLMVGHTGSLPGILSAMFFQPDEKFGIVMITNGCTRGPKTDITPYPIIVETINKMYEILIKE